MTDPMQNPQTGHGVECLCDRCIRILFRDEPRASTAIISKAEQIDAHGNRVIRAMVTDASKMKDGVS